MPAKVEHDFRQGCPTELFDVDGDESSLVQKDDGLWMMRHPDSGVRAMRVCAIVEGDFDIVAGYRDLKISDADATWHCGIGLAVSLENPTANRCTINRRRDRMHGHHYVAFGEKEVNPAGKLTWTGGANLVSESTSGRLRLARRGNQIYALHALGDSPIYRVVKVTEVPPGRIGIHGLRFITDVGKGMETEVVWTRLKIRAERVDLLQVESIPETLAALDERRNRLPEEILDLTTQTHAEAGFVAAEVAGGNVLSDQRGTTTSVQGGSSSTRLSLMTHQAWG